MVAGRQADRPDPPARGVRQRLLRRPQAQPPVHGRQPVALRRVYRHARRRTGLIRRAIRLPPALFELRRTGPPEHPRLGSPRLACGEGIAHLDVIARSDLSAVAQRAKADAVALRRKTRHRLCRHCERSEAIHGSAQFDMDCFVAEFIIGPAQGGTRWLPAMTRKQKALATAPKNEGPRAWVPAFRGGDIEIVDSPPPEPPPS